MDLISYTPSFPQLPEGVVRYNKKKHKGPKDIYAHAHFMKGVQVYDSNCSYCKGIKKPKKSRAEIAEKKRMKYKYYLEWKASVEK